MTTAILGAGALGLTAALRLAQRGERVTVIERETLPGGLAAGFEIGHDIWLEKFYHHLFRSDTRAVAMIRELGLGDRLEWGRPVTATLVEGWMHQLDSPVSLLRFTPLSPSARIRMGAALVLLKAMPNPKLLEGYTAAEWLDRSMGADAYRTVWEPLLRGKFGVAASEIAMPWFWARVHDRTQQLGYLRGGFQQFYDRLAEVVRRAGGEIRFAEAISALRKRNDGRLEVDSSAGSETFDRVVSTFASRLTAQLAPDLPETWCERHVWGRAYGAHCLIIALDRPLTAVYWLNVNHPGFPFMALVEHTNYRSPDEYAGRHLVYLGNYRPMDDPLMSDSKEAVMGQFLPHLARINPSFDASWVTDAWMFRAPFAQPIVTVDYRDHIAPFGTPVPGLYVANMFQVYPHDRGQNYSIALAERLVKSLA